MKVELHKYILHKESPTMDIYEITRVGFDPADSEPLIYVKFIKSVKSDNKELIGTMMWYDSPRVRQMYTTRELVHKFREMTQAEIVLYAL